MNELLQRLTAASDLGIDVDSAGQDRRYAERAQRTARL